MKTFVLVILAAAAVVSTGFSAFAAENKSPAKVVVYYFHGTFRCPTCTTMEKYSREAIETNFKEALASGLLEFKAVNVEERGNEHFANDYQLYTKSLVLSLVKNGKEERSKNLAKIWDHARNKQKFITYVTAEVKDFLKDTQ